MSADKQDDKLDTSSREIIKAIEKAHGVKLTKEQKQALVNHKCPYYAPDSPQASKPTLADVVNGTPKGQEAVRKAVEQSIKVQEAMSLAAKQPTTQPQSYSVEDLIQEILLEHWLNIETMTTEQHKRAAKIATQQIQALLESECIKARTDEIQDFLAMFGHSLTATQKDSIIKRLVTITAGSKPNA